MRIVCISDTHLRHLPRYGYQQFFKIPAGDLLLHTGDLCLEGDVREVKDAMDWLASLPHKNKVFIAGNHDWLFQKNPVLARSMVPPGVTYLEDSMTTVDGYTIYGSPWQPEFMNWAFNLPRGEALLRKWKMVPEGVDILMTHGPPYGISDWSKFGEEHVGCRDMREELRRIKPRLHAFGHVHGGYGRTQKEGTIFVNAAMCDEAYRPFHDPIVVDLKR